MNGQAGLPGLPGTKVTSKNERLMDPMFFYLYLGSTR